MAAPVATPDADLIERLAKVLHGLGLPCGCQAEVERTVAVFAELEARRARRRMLGIARDRARAIAAFVPFLDDLHAPDGDLGADEIRGVADTFRVIAATASDAAAALDLLADGPGPPRA